MTPLCVTHTPCDLTEVGLEPELFARPGFINQVSPNRKAYREMVKLIFKLGAVVSTSEFLQHPLELQLTIGSRANLG